MLNILFISQYFFPEQFSNNEIARNLVKRGHSITAVSCVPNYPAGKFYDGYSNILSRSEDWEGVKIRRAWTFPRGQTKIRLLVNYLVYPFAAFIQMRKTEYREADVSFVSMPSPLLQALAGIFAKRFWGIPTVYWVQDLWPETPQYMFNIRNRFVLALLDSICGWIYRQADIVLVQSEAMKPLIQRHGIPNHRVMVLNNTAAEFYRPLEATDYPSEAAKMPDRPFKLMFAGNVGESQGLEVLVEAAYRLRDRKDIAFVIVGEGRAMGSLLDKIDHYGVGDSFTFCGRYPEDRMPLFFAQADCLFFSLRNYPNFAITLPYKVQTYLASGVPIIASAPGEGARIVDDANAGFTCRPEDANALAEVIARMADLDLKTRRELGHNARRYFERVFLADVVYSGLEKVLIQVANQKVDAGA